YSWAAASRPWLSVTRNASLAAHDGRHHPRTRPPTGQRGRTYHPPRCRLVAPDAGRPARPVRRRLAEVTPCAVVWQRTNLGVLSDGACPAGSGATGTDPADRGGAVTDRSG